MKDCRLVPRVTGDISKDSNMCKLQNLCCNSKVPATNLISTFPRTILVFRQAECDPSLLIDLVRKWYNKEAYHNLKIATVRLSSNYRFPRVGNWPAGIELIRELDPKSWIPERRPDKYYFKSEYVRLDIVPWYDCTHYLDIEQKGGGKIGSVYAAIHSFHFYVWP